MSFNAIRENKILAKISEFTVHVSVKPLLECAIVMIRFHETESAAFLKFVVFLYFYRIH